MTRRTRQHATQPVPSPNAPSRERRQHDRIAIAVEQIVDADGGIGLPHIAETAMARLYRHGDIGLRELDAAHEFRRLYRLAFLDPLRAATLGERVVGYSHLPHGSEAARRRCNAILRAMGSREDSLAASCVQSVIGSEMSVAEWARGLRWGKRPINDQVAKGILLAVLQALPALLEKRA